jgi:hypothetical protein
MVSLAEGERDLLADALRAAWPGMTENATNNRFLYIVRIEVTNNQ